MTETRRLTEADDRLSAERARSEDGEDQLALARYQLRQQQGEVTYVLQTDARAALGLPASHP